MAAGHASEFHALGKADRSISPVVGFLMCCAVVALAMGSLWIGLSGLMRPEPDGLLRTLGGFVGFYVVFGLTLVAAVRQKR